MSRPNKILLTNLNYAFTALTKAVTFQQDFTLTAIAETLSQARVHNDDRDASKTSFWHITRKAPKFVSVT